MKIPALTLGMGDHRSGKPKSFPTYSLNADLTAARERHRTEGKESKVRLLTLQTYTIDRKPTISRRGQSSAILLGRKHR
jgi:hypothetical protein